MYDLKPKQLYYKIQKENVEQAIDYFHIHGDNALLMFLEDKEKEDNDKLSSLKRPTDFPKKREKEIEEFTLQKERYYYTVQWLLYHEKINPENFEQELRLAVRSGHISIVKLLLKHPRVDPRIKQNNLFITAAYSYHIDIAELLLDWRGTNGEYIDLSLYPRKLYEFYWNFRDPKTWQLIKQWFLKHNIDLPNYLK